MRVVTFGTYDVRAHPRTQVLAEGLRDLGHEVVEVNRPLDLPTADRVALLRGDGPVLGVVAALLRCWVRLVAARLRLRGPVDAVLVGYLGHLDVLLARVLFPRTTIALDYLVSAADTARDRRLDGSTRRLRVLQALDRLACAAADLVVVDTQESIVTVPAARRGRAVVAPVGAPTAWFRTPQEPTEPRPLRVVFFGLFTPLQGAPVLAEGLRRAVDAGLDVKVTMVGSGQDEAAARAAAPDGVTWLPWVEAEELPALVASHDVCLGIVGATAKAQRVVPNKAYQGAAAGCVVLTSATAPQRRLLPAASAFVRPGDPAAVADALLELAAEPDALLRRRRASHAEALTTFAPAACAAPLVSAVAARSRTGAAAGR